ncbi:MAG: excinuclease ABC subunit UvrC [Bacteroidales bacterium]|jgi:excinuclease ABC subunit C|nr:excinuclease ABC subunit UvrC [Bacteroidales bacterium]
MRINPYIESILERLPEKNGVYRYLDKDGTIIYVGKAKNLKRRVASYFQKDQDHPRILLLLRHLADIEFTIVDTEYDALLLENNLIKEYQPKYNVQLKDDKTYPWLCLSNEFFPRLYATRRKTDEKARYFGPYPSVKIMKTILDMVSEIYLLRDCKLNLTEANINAKKYKACLNYHIKKCMGVCVGKQSHEGYMDNIQQAINIIQGNTALVLNTLRKQMMTYADEMAFEKAHEVKMKILSLEKYQAKSTIVNSTISNVDVFNIVEDMAAAYVCYFHVVNGSIIKTQALTIKYQLNETIVEALLYAIIELRKTTNSMAHEIIVPFALDCDMRGIKITVPKRNEKEKLLVLALRNATAYMFEMQKQKEFSNPESHRKQLLTTIQNDLNLPRPPAYIECFDNSNIQGSYPVAAMVCFRGGKPSKKEYRIFNIQTVDKPDDFATMKEVIKRRYGRLLKEESPFPDLIVVDGGKGQISAAYSALEELGIENKISLIGIAKRLEEIYRPNDTVPLFINKKSETQRVIQHLRDEAHRFGIMHHRQRRDKSMTQTELTCIKGIGSMTAEKLLSEFRSVNTIKKTSLEDLSFVIGKDRAIAVYNYYQTGKTSEEKEEKEEKENLDT